jgi:hypothetical protein
LPLLVQKKLQSIPALSYSNKKNPDCKVLIQLIGNAGLPLFTGMDQSQKTIGCFFSFSHDQNNDFLTVIGNSY